MSYLVSTPNKEVCYVNLQPKVKEAALDNVAIYAACEQRKYYARSL